MREYSEINDLDKIESDGVTSSKIEMSDIYAVKIGGFGSSDSIKTYLCSMNLNQLENDIIFYENLSNDKAWPISQIVQREVDKLRVSDISKDYVLGKGREVKYFPPIIVALIPKASGGNFSLKLDYNTDNSQRIKERIYEQSEYRSNIALKKYFLNAPNRSLVEGLYLLEVSSVFDFNIFSWDKEKFYAVVIDGQHRLDALLKSKLDDPSISTFKQDVVFLDCSHLINSKRDKFTPIEVVRRVFVDINTNAKKVSFVRQILMDDKDLASLFVQSLVDSVGKDGNDKEENRYIPSLLVDWYSENLKHSLPHITSILSLYQILSDYLIKYNLSSISDHRSPNKVKNWVKRMNDYFLVDSSIRKDNLEYKKLEKSLKDFSDGDQLLNDEYSVLEDSERESEIFNFDYRILDIAQRNFEIIFVESIVKVFNEFLPYSKIKEVINEEGGFQYDSLINKALLSSRNKLAKSKRLRENFFSIKNVLEDQFSFRYFLILTVLGQKTIFNLFFKRIFKNFNSSFDNDKSIIIADDFLKRINGIVDINIGNNVFLFGKKETHTIAELEDELLDLGTISTSFWEGIIYEDEKIIYNTQGIASFTSFFEYVFELIDCYSKDPSNIESIPFDISFQEARTKRIIRKRFLNVYDEEQIGILCDKVIAKKKEYIIEFIREAVGNDSSNTIDDIVE